LAEHIEFHQRGDDVRADMQLWEVLFVLAAIDFDLAGAGYVTRLRCFTTSDRVDCLHINLRLN
jgi:hypothetical protein